MTTSLIWYNPWFLLFLNHDHFQKMVWLPRRLEEAWLQNCVDDRCGIFSGKANSIVVGRTVTYISNENGFSARMRVVGWVSPVLGSCRASDMWENVRGKVGLRWYSFVGTAKRNGYHKQVRCRDFLCALEISKQYKIKEYIGERK